MYQIVENMFKIGFEFFTAFIGFDIQYWFM